MKFWLSEIRIKNLLSYKDAIFTNLRNYNVLIGKNNAGKSNLFKILKLLETNAKSSGFNTSILYDESEDLPALIVLKFELSSIFRREIFEILYDQGYLERIFIVHEGKKGYLDRNQWNKRELALEWLCGQGFYNFICISLNYNKRYHNLIIQEIHIFHNDFDKEQIVYEVREREDQIDVFIHRYSNKLDSSESFQTFFTDFNPDKSTEFSQDTIYNIIRKNPNHLKSIKEYNPILLKIIYDLLKEFLLSIYVIPYDRQFKGNSDRIAIVDTTLDLNGSNFVKFIDKLISIDKKQWVDDLNNELQTYFSDIKELTNIVDRGDQSVLILKEHGLLSRLRKDNFGA